VVVACVFGAVDFILQRQGHSRDVRDLESFHATRLAMNIGEGKAIMLHYLCRRV
jgi:hypothetical protein